MQSQIKLTPEAKLRVLRTMRLNLCHKFCHDVLRETYAESLSEGGTDGQRGQVATVDS